MRGKQAKKLKASKAQRAFFIKACLCYYQKSGRELPWRNTKNPYKIWVSEIILQQTQVQRGIEYYKRFLRVFPNVSSLAQATWPQVLAVWRGLGYYGRARNMRLAAKHIHKELQGRFPKTDEELKSLPGVGPYTAAAIASFCHQAKAAAFDTNMRRLVSRFFAVDVKTARTLVDEIFASLQVSSRDLNYAIMDVGSQICKSKKPLCRQCPLVARCASAGLFIKEATKKARSKTLPGRKRASTKTAKHPWIDVGVACIHAQGRILLGKRKTKEKKLLWELPGGKREKGEDIRACLKREIREELGVEVAVRPPFFVYEVPEDKPRNYRLHFCRCQILRGKPKALEHEELRWVEASELEQYPTFDSNAAAFRIIACSKFCSKKV